MATVTGVTLQKVQQIKDDTVVSARVENGVLYFKKGNGVTEFSVGRVIMPAIDAWPVGSIFMSVSPTNPKQLLGVPSDSEVTWVRWGRGRMPLSLDENSPAYDSSEEVGGEATHLLTAQESGVGEHIHGVNVGHAEIGEPNWALGDSSVGRRTFNVAADTATAATAQNAQVAHNNMPPFITVYMWKRTK